LKHITCNNPAMQYNVSHRGRTVFLASAIIGKFMQQIIQLTLSVCHMLVYSVKTAKSIIKLFSS